MESMYTFQYIHLFSDLYTPYLFIINILKYHKKTVTSYL
jgi:hypothetical protein